MPAGRRSNPLALVVLCSLAEKAQHPYEIASTLRERHKDESIRLNYGSLYSVVNSLVRRGLIAVQQTSQEGRRPERTVYELTDPGRIEMEDWLGQLLGTPVKEYPQFEAGLSLMPILPPGTVASLLRSRCTAIKSEVTGIEERMRMLKSMKLPRIFGLEVEYELALLQADLAWTESLAADIEAGTLAGMDLWRSFHKGKRFSVSEIQAAQDSTENS